MEPKDNDKNMTCLGQAFVLLIVAACLGGAAYLFWPNLAGQSDQSTQSAPAGNNPGLAQPEPLPAGGLEIGLAYGTEKERWLTQAVQEFMKSPEGKGIAVHLLPCGSREGAQRILDSDHSIHAWLPASDLYTGYFQNEWQVRHSGGDPIVKSENLLLTPMAFVFWQPRYQAFLTKYKEVNFHTIGLALAEKEGWKGIANQPDWGFFKFGHTSPVKSNSGGTTLILMACEYAKKSRSLGMEDILNAGFRDWMRAFESAADTTSSSTGTMMRNMVLKGPSAYDAVCVYESLAIDYLKNAEGRWGKLQVCYPPRNLWNNHPFYILDVPWSSAAHRKALEKLLAFLMSERIQRASLDHGFRPGNPAVAINGPESPFVKYQPYGIKIDINPDCVPPAGEVVENLLQGWQRSVAGN